MLNQQRASPLSKPQQRRVSRINDVYEEIIKNFDKQAEKIKFKFSNPSFDDAQIIRPRKTLPKLQIETEKKYRMKFYSNKLVVNQAVYINERKQCNFKEADEFNFRKPNVYNPNTTKDNGILSDRNKRIMELYRRAERDAEFSPTRIRFTKQIQSTKQPNQENTIKFQSDLAMKNSEDLNSKQKRMIDILKEAKQKKRKLELPFMRPQRSKSNIVINSYSTQPENLEKHTLQCKKVEPIGQGEQQKQVSKQKRVKTLKKIKYEPRKDIQFVKKRFNWKLQPLQLIKIDRQQFYNLIRHYLNIDDITPPASGFYKAYVGPGNNCALIKKLLKDRGYWTIVQSIQDQPNFVWTQLKSAKFTQILKPAQQKQYKVINRNFSCIQNNFEIQNFIKFKRNDFINGCQRIFQSKHFLQIMNQIRSRFQNGNNIIFFSRLKQAYTDYLEEQEVQQSKSTNQGFRSADIKLHNHMDNAGAIGDKKGLLYMMTQYCQIFKQNLNTFVPQTVHVQSPQNSSMIFEKIPEGPWILKPGEATNRGTGITIHTSQQTLLSEIGKKKKHKGGQKFTHIVQKYIDPLLYCGRKFDIRIWVLWSGRRLWWYKEGYLRTSSKDFTLKNLNKFIHLTNDAIQSQSQDFGKHEPANKLSFNQFEKYLQSQHKYTSFNQEILAQMKNIAIKAFRMGNIVFDNKNRQHNFQLFGLDFLIDKNLKPWLIECNTNPCLQINCSLLARLVPNMLQNVMNLTIDAYFPPPLKKKPKQNNWSYETFKFQLIYNGRIDLQMKEKLLLSSIKINYNTEYQKQFIEEDCMQGQQMENKGEN